jgi:hypothetical protein
MLYNKKGITTDARICGQSKKSPIRALVAYFAHNIEAQNLDALPCLPVCPFNTRLYICAQQKFLI